MKELLLKLFRIESDLIKEQKRTNEFLIKILAEMERSSDAIEAQNLSKGISKENGYNTKY